MTTATKKDAIALLKADHKNVKELFDDFEKAEESEEKWSIAQEAIKELKIHSVVEEEIFYPAIRQQLDESEIMDEAEEEHRVAKTLIEELSQHGESTEHFEAKFMVLAENIRHHIKEEESEMFKEARESDADLESLGEEMMARKKELMANEDVLEEAVEASEVKPYQKLGV